jgi:hypothetical protein
MCINQHLCADLSCECAPLGDPHVLGRDSVVAVDVGPDPVQEDERGCDDNVDV